MSTKGIIEEVMGKPFHMKRLPIKPKKLEKPKITYIRIPNNILLNDAIEKIPKNTDIKDIHIYANYNGELYLTYTLDNLEEIYQIELKKYEKELIKYNKWLEVNKYRIEKRQQLKEEKFKIKEENKLKKEQIKIQKRLEELNQKLGNK